MPERPIILFPTPERAGRSQKTPVFKNYRRPSFDRQYNRLQPTFQSLRTAFEQKNIIVQQGRIHHRQRDCQSNGAGQTNPESRCAA